MKAERILVTGATGFLGSYVVPQLAQRYREVACLVRPTSDIEHLKALGVELRVADLGDERALGSAFQGCDTLVNLASLGFGHAPGIVRAARQAGMRRAVFISTTAIFTSLPARSRFARMQAEKWVRESGLAFTVLRPTMIYGAERDRNVARLIRYLARNQAIVVPGSGRALQQPVHVEDVADAVIAATERASSLGRSYNLAGPTPLSFNDMVETTARALGRKVVRLHVPLGPVLVAAQLCAALRLPLPVRPEQVERLNEDKTFDICAAERDLGFRPRDFGQGVMSEITGMGLAARE